MRKVTSKNYGGIVLQPFVGYAHLLNIFVDFSDHKSSTFMIYYDAKEMIVKANHVLIMKC